MASARADSSTVVAVRLALLIGDVTTPYAAGTKAITVTKRYDRAGATVIEGRSVPNVAAGNQAGSDNQVFKEGVVSRPAMSPGSAS